MLKRLLIFIFLSAFDNICHSSNPEIQDFRRKYCQAISRNPGFLKIDRAEATLFAIAKEAPELLKEFNLLGTFRDLYISSLKEKFDILLEEHKTISFQLQTSGSSEEYIHIDFQGSLQSKKYFCLSHTPNSSESPEISQLFLEATQYKRNEQKEIKNSHSHYLCHPCGKLMIDFPGKPGVIGTGSLISPSCVLTTGHCLFNEEFGGYAGKIIFHYSIDSCGWKSTAGKLGFIVSGWKNKNKDICDYGMIVLKDSININKYMGLSIKDDQELKDLHVNIMGFPSKLQNSHTMYTGWGIIKQVQKSLISHNVVTNEGQSGASIWILEGKQPYSVGIHALGFDPDETNQKRRVNKGVKITDIHFQNIKGWEIEHENSNQKGLVY